MNLKQQSEQLLQELLDQFPPSLVQDIDKGFVEIMTSGLDRNALQKGDRAPDFCLPNAILLGVACGTFQRATVVRFRRNSENFSFFIMFIRCTQTQISFLPSIEHLHPTDKNVQESTAQSCGS